MTVRVRFAPSPTGYLHIGGARTALYNYLFARANGGKYILRIEDTDEARSRPEYEEAMIKELKWLGIEHDEGPDVSGGLGPYRQSERMHIYKREAENLIEKGLAYYCFCSEDTLAKKKEVLVAKNLAPHYDGTCKSISKDAALSRIKNGEKASIRFAAPDKDYSFVDHVRGEVKFPKGMVGDFVILRSSGLPVYNYCCVVDDWLMKISHVIRAEEHLPNTLRQLMLYEAFDAKAPEFAHLSLLVNKDRQKLSKRDGAVSVTLYREEGYLPETLNNYLALLGWSHPEEKDIFSMNEIIPKFDLRRFTKSPAVFDFEKCKWVNGQHLRLLAGAVLFEACEKWIDHNSEFGKMFHTQNREWKIAFCELFKNHVVFFSEMNLRLADVFSPEIHLDDKLTEIKSWESTPLIQEYLKNDVEKMVEQGKIWASEADLDRWSTHIKTEMKIKGKFLFQGIRGVLTGKDHGPDLKYLIPLTPLKILLQRML